MNTFSFIKKYNAALYKKINMCVLLILLLSIINIIAFTLISNNISNAKKNHLQLQETLSWLDAYRANKSPEKLATMPKLLKESDIRSKVLEISTNIKSTGLNITNISNTEVPFTNQAPFYAYKSSITFSGQWDQLLHTFLMFENNKHLLSIENCNIDTSQGRSIVTLEYMLYFEKG